MPFIMPLPSAAPSLLAWPSTADQLQTLLSISLGASRLECHGTTKTQAKCKLAVAKTQIPSVQDLLKRIVKRGSLLAAKTLLDELAHLIMCKKFHQNQAAEQLSRWTLALSELATSRVKNEQNENAVDVKVDTVKLEQVESPLKSHFDLFNAAASEVKVEEPEDTTMNLNPPLTTPIPTQEKTKSPKRKTDRRRASSQATESNKPKHIFVPYGQPRSTRQLNQAIKEKIQRKLLASENPRSNGIIYVYTFPDDYRQSSPFLKIGHTTDVERRMKAWQTQCGYRPEKLADSKAELSIKVESLVHAHLYNARRRERDGCPQCKVKHHEWFDIKYSKVAHVIGLWTDWSRRQPYDESGVLEARWRERLETVNLDDPDCWESFVNDEFEEEETDLEYSDGESSSDDYDDESESDDYQA